MLAPDEGGTVWVSAGNGEGASSLYHVAEGKVDLQRSLPGVSSFVYRAPDKTYWFGGEGGLWYMADGGLTQFELPRDMAGFARALASMTDDGSGGFLVSFGTLGLYRFKDGAWAEFKSGRDLPPEAARKVCPTSGVIVAYTDPQRRVWLAERSRRHRSRPQRGTPEAFERPCLQGQCRALRPESRAPRAAVTVAADADRDRGH